MSRCFPFPPPGYEKKARTDDVDLLKKEKHKEKKHKKEKKDKEKREDKDRKDKDKSDRKHREKKERKEKSKDRKKDKEREKDRDKTTASQEKQISAQVDNCNGDYRLNHNEKDVKDPKITSNERSMDKFVLDLCNRISDEGKGSASQSIERSPFTGRTNHDRIIRNENGILPMEKNKKKEARVDDIRKMEGQGVRVGANIWEGFRNRAQEIPRIIASSPVQNIVGKEKTRNGVNTSEGLYSRVEKSPRISGSGDKNYKKEDEDKRGSKRKDKEKEKKSHGKNEEKKKEEKVKDKNAQKIKDNNKNGFVVNHNIKLPPLVPDGNRTLIVGPNMKLPQLVPGGDKSLSVDGDLIRKKDIEANGFLQGGDNNSPGVDGNLKKRKDIEANGFSRSGNNSPAVDGNLKKRKDIEANGFLHSGEKSPTADGNLKLRKHIEDSGFLHGGDKSPALDGNLKKRKDIANGFLQKTNFVPNKKPRPTPHPSIESGRKIEPCQAPVQHTPDRKVLPPSNPIKVNNNEHKLNGKIEAQSLSISLKKPSLSPSPSSSRTHDQVSWDPGVKPRHVDTKVQIVQSPVLKPCHLDDTDKIAQSHVVKPHHPNNTDKIAQSPVVTPRHPVNTDKIDQLSQAPPMVKPPHHPDSKPSLPPPSSRTKPDKIYKAPAVKVKPPHPDTKYLSEVLSVPKIEENCDFDDEEWLFSSTKKVNLSAEATETQRVWDKALRIETADVCALPYVIPY